MARRENWSQWWCRFLGFSADGYHKAVEILCERYIEESQHVTRFTQHAQRMQYPQFRDKLLQIAAEESKHVEWLAEKIRLFGGKLPKVAEIPKTEMNSWQYLLADLAEEKQCGDELLEQIQDVQSDLPGVTEVLKRIHDDGEKHRDAIWEMLMRSDPQSVWPA